MNVQLLVATLFLRFEHLLQLVLDDAFAVEVGARLDVGVELRVEVLDLVEEDFAAAVLFQIPAVALEFIQSVTEAGEVHAGGGEVFGQLFLGQAHAGEFQKVRRRKSISLRPAKVHRCRASRLSA